MFCTKLTPLPLDAKRVFLKTTRPLLAIQPNFHLHFVFLPEQLFQNVAMMLGSNLKTSQSFKNYFSRFEQFLNFVKQVQNLTSSTEVVQKLRKKEIPESTVYQWFHDQVAQWQVSTVKSKISAINSFLIVLINAKLTDLFPALPRLISAWARMLAHEEGKNAGLCLPYNTIKKLVFLAHEFAEINASFSDCCLLFFWLATRSKESYWLTFRACSIFAHPQDDNLRVLHVTLICPKTATTPNPNQHIMIAEYLQDLDMCAIRAYMRILDARLPNQITLLASITGDPLTKNEFYTIFGKFFDFVSSQFKIQRDGLVFYCFRISGLNFYANDLAMSVEEVKAISRHKKLSTMLQDFYYAKDELTKKLKVCWKIAQSRKANSKLCKNVLSLRTQRRFL